MNNIKNAIGVIKAYGLNISGSEVMLAEAEQVENTIIEALEKQIPKKPKYIEGDYDMPLCPCCGMSVDENEEKHCSVCGQALDRGDNE